MARYEHLEGRDKKHREVAGKRRKGGSCREREQIQRSPQVSRDSRDDSKGHKGPCHHSGSAPTVPTRGGEAGSHCTDLCTGQQIRAAEGTQPHEHPSQAHPAPRSPAVPPNSNRETPSRRTKAPVRGIERSKRRARHCLTRFTHICKQITLGESDWSLPCLAFQPAASFFS